MPRSYAQNAQIPGTGEDSTVDVRRWRERR